MRILLFLAVLWLVLCRVAFADDSSVVRVGNANSFYTDIYAEILERSGIDYQIIDQAENRLRRAFEQGDITIDCCVAPHWHFSEREKEVQVFSRAITFTVDYVLLPSNRDVDITSSLQLNTLPVALVGHYNYQGIEKFNKIISTDSIMGAARRVAGGSAVATLVSRRRFETLKALHPDLAIRLGPVHSSFPIVIRVQKDRPDLLEKINAAINAYNVEKAAHSVIAASRIGNSTYRGPWEAILEEAGIEANLVDGSREARRQMFAKGQMQLDCCSAPEWRDRPEEISVQLFTDPFAVFADYIVVQEDKDPSDFERGNLGRYKAAIVEGFTYREEETFGARQYYYSLYETLGAVASGEADFTIVNSAEFSRRQALTPLPLKFGPLYTSLPVRARVHKDRADLLPRLNAAIKALKAAGKINELIGQRVRGKGPSLDSKPSVDR